MAVTGETLRIPDGTAFLIVQSAAVGGERIEFEITMSISPNTVHATREAAERSSDKRGTP
jgi:hypothetical protein